MKNNWKKLAYTDYLTGCYNIRYLYSKDFSKKRPKYQYVYFIDINSLGKINKDYGFLYANNLIQKLSSFIKSKIKRNGILFRIGGDEFLCFTTNKINIGHRLLTVTEMNYVDNINYILHSLSKSCVVKL